MTRRMLGRLKATSDRAAVGLAALYGSAITIWLFTGYSLLGAIVSPDVRDALLYWGSAAQLVYCPLAVYVAKLVLDRQDTTHQKVDDLHGKVHDLHGKVADLHAQTSGDGCAELVSNEAQEGASDVAADRTGNGD